MLSVVLISSLSFMSVVAQTPSPSTDSSTNSNWIFIGLLLILCLAPRCLNIWLRYLTCGRCGVGPVEYVELTARDIEASPVKAKKEVRLETIEVNEVKEEKVELVQKTKRSENSCCGL